MDEQREGILANATKLVLRFDNFMHGAHTFLEHFGRELSQVSRNLLTQMPQVQNIKFGFSDDAERGDLTEWKVNKTVTQYLLSLNFPNLTTLTLENVIFTDGALIDFVARHGKTLRSSRSAVSPWISRRTTCVLVTHR